MGVSRVNASFTDEHTCLPLSGFRKGGGGALCSIVYVVRELDGEGSCGLNAYALVELSWMVFEAGSELKLVTDGVVTVTTFVVFVDTDAGVSEVTFAPLV